MSESSEQAPARRRRGPGRPFKKGQPSPNPGGRPRLWPEVRALAQAHTDEVIETLVYLMHHSAKDEVRRAAACDLWDRAWGRPVSTVVADVSVVQALDVDVLRASLAARLASFAASSSTVEVEPLALPGGQVETENPLVVSANACSATSREAQPESFPGHSQPYPSGDSR